MNAKYYFKRIINNKLKLAIILLIFIFIIGDILLTIKDISGGHSVPMPYRTTFLSSFLNNGAQMLLTWYLPLYFLLIAADDCIEDYKTGYRNILITKWGKQKYFKNNIIKGFVIGFFLILTLLALNFLLSNIAFAGGTYLPGTEDSPIMKGLYINPFVTNWIYIFMFSFISGIVSMGASAFAISLHKRYIVYPLVFILWYLPSTVQKSIILAFEPFSEYLLFYSWQAILFVIAINIAAVVFAYIKVMKYEQV